MRKWHVFAKIKKKSKTGYGLTDNRVTTFIDGLRKYTTELYAWCSCCCGDAKWMNQRCSTKLVREVVKSNHDYT
jgi:hypothetical protein